MKNPYTTWCAAYTASKGKAAKLDLYRRSAEGEFGDEVKYSLFGIGSFDPKYVDDVIDAESIRNMKFYAKLEVA